jgi:hypothetical protein
MALTENDLELLECYLDDALEIGEVEGVRARIEGDGEWAGALEQLRTERAGRRAFFAALEPDDTSLAKLTARVHGSMNRRRNFARLLRPMRYVAATAACLVIGFVARGVFDRPAGDATQPGDHSLAVSNRGGVKVEKIETYQVTLRDESGKVVGVQQFNSIEKAQEFAADLARWQAHSERLASGQFVLRNDRF